VSLLRPRRAQPEARTASLTAAELILAQRTGGGNHSGVPVNDESAMRHHAVFGCVDVISEVVATLPWHEYRDTGPAGIPAVQPMPTLLSRPDPANTSLFLSLLCLPSIRRLERFGVPGNAAKPPMRSLTFLKFLREAGLVARAAGRAWSARAAPRP